jgi:hypothetical protein
VKQLAIVVALLLPWVLLTAIDHVLRRSR